MEFENLQIEVPVNDESSPMFAAKIYEKKYHNKKDFVVGFNPNDKEFIDKKNRRAKRFGIKEREKQAQAQQLQEETTSTGEEAERIATDDSDSTNTVTTIGNEQPKKATTNFDSSFFKDVDLKKINWPPVLDCALDQMRLDAIHIYGVDNMSTKNIFAYFDLFGPDTLEWIDDRSCNVIWDDEATVSKVMESMSKTYKSIKEIQKEHREEMASSMSPTITTQTQQTSEDGVTIKVEEGEESEQEFEETGNKAISIEDDEDDIDPRDVWRLGYPYQEYQLFMRPATMSDKKLPGAASRSQYYLMYGKNEDKKKVKGIVSKSRKRKLESMKQKADEVFKLKEPDVKIVALDELLNEGVVSKMEVDEDEPTIKRMNIQTDTFDPRSRTMMADRVEIGQQFGKRIDDGYGTGASAVRDRLGLRNDDTMDDPHRVNDLRARLDKSNSIYDRLGRRGGDSTKTEEMEDARGEIERSKRTNAAKSKRRYREDGYEKDGVYHDIYRAEDASDIKEEPLDDSPPPRYHHRRPRSDEEEEREPPRRSNIKSRLGTVNSSSSGSTDLRDRLEKRRGGGVDKNDKNSRKDHRKRYEEEPDIKDEPIDNDRLNLCIEIKQEPEEDMDFEF